MAGRNRLQRLGRVPEPVSAEVAIQQRVHTAECNRPVASIRCWAEKHGHGEGAVPLEFEEIIVQDTNTRFLSAADVEQYHDKVKQRAAQVQKQMRLRSMHTDNSLEAVRARKQAMHEYSSRITAARKESKQRHSGSAGSNPPLMTDQNTASVAQAAIAAAAAAPAAAPAAEVGGLEATLAGYSQSSQLHSEPGPLEPPAEADAGPQSLHLGQLHLAPAEPSPAAGQPSGSQPSPRDLPPDAAASVSQPATAAATAAAAPPGAVSQHQARGRLASLPPARRSQHAGALKAAPVAAAAGPLWTQGGGSYAMNPAAAAAAGARVVPLPGDDATTHRAPAAAGTPVAQPCPSGTAPRRSPSQLAVDDSVHSVRSQPRAVEARWRALDKAVVARAAGKARRDKLRLPVLCSCPHGTSIFDAGYTTKCCNNCPLYRNLRKHEHLLAAVMHNEGLHEGITLKQK